MSLVVKRPPELPGQSASEEDSIPFDETMARLLRALPANHPATKEVKHCFELAREVLVEWSEWSPTPEYEDLTPTVLEVFDLVGDWMRGTLDWPEVEQGLRAIAKEFPSELDSPPTRPLPP